MITSYLSTAYLPPIEYFAHIHKSNKVIIDTYESYKKQSYRNRCHIYSDKGLMSISIPVQKPNGNNSKTNEVVIFNAENWKKNHWKTIESAYMASPYFEYYREEIKEVFFKDFIKLVEFNSSLLSLLLEILQIENNVSYSDKFIEPNTFSNDLRFSISPKVNSKLSLDNYIQVFNERHGFIENLSILDLIFNMGPESVYYLDKIELNPPFSQDMQSSHD
ncbi:MAG: hypothetical protein C0598_10130 [Marinilabiliales bacterium]|nr:MAG: hypothetical protein C0598_10130 [Marinilabiliales bacterium]